VFAGSVTVTLPYDGDLYMDQLSVYRAPCSEDGACEPWDLQPISGVTKGSTDEDGPAAIFNTSSFSLFAAVTSKASTSAGPGGGNECPGGEPATDAPTSSFSNPSGPHITAEGVVPFPSSSYLGGFAILSEKTPGTGPSTLSLYFSTHADVCAYLTEGLYPAGSSGIALSITLQGGGSFSAASYPEDVDGGIGAAVELSSMVSLVGQAGIAPQLCVAPGFYSPNLAEVNITAIDADHVEGSFDTPMGQHGEFNLPFCVGPEVVMNELCCVDPK
jgi:hypothetical protein